MMKHKLKRRDPGIGDFLGAKISVGWILAFGGMAALAWYAFIRKPAAALSGAKAGGQPPQALPAPLASAPLPPAPTAGAKTDDKNAKVFTPIFGAKRSA